MKKMRSLVFLFTMLILIPTLITAQTGQVGSIKGTVTTNDGIELPGVAVTLKSPVLVIGKMTAVTNLNGNYRFVSLPPGTYELSFELEGMVMFIRRGIVINANINIDIDAVMQFKTVQEQIVVEGKAPTIDVRTVAKTTTIDLALLNSLPAQRNLTSYVNMTPGMTGYSSYSSSQGAGVRDNQYNLDGVQMNDPAIGTNSSLAFSMDIMDEVSIQTGGLSAEYGSTKGAVVNVVSKSGGNDFSGTLSGYYNSLDLMSDNTKGTDLAGSLSGPKYEYEPGLALGGPLAKDKLWFFLNLSTKRSSRYSPGFPYDKPKNTVPIKDNNILPFIKLTYQPNQNNKIVASFNYNKRDIDNDWVDQYQNEDTAVTYKNPSIVGNLQWTANFGTNLMTNVKLGYVDVDKNWYAHNQESSYHDDYLGFYSGGYGYDDLNTRRRLQFDVDGTYFIDNFHGSHELKFGVQTAYGTSRLNRPLNGAKDEKGFSRVWNYLWDGELYYSEWFNGYDQKAALLNVGVFLNDVWNIGKHLTLNFGVRFDHSRNILPKQGDLSNPLARGDFGYIGHPEVEWDMVVPETKALFSWNNFSPRVGLVYDLFADGKTLLKANFSRYLQDNFTAIGFELNPVNWTGYGMYVAPDGTPYWPVDYTYTTGMTTEVGYKDHKLKTPYTNEITVGIERELFNDFSVGLTYIRKFDRDLIEDVDGAALDMDKLMNEGVLDWTAYKKVNAVDPFDGKTVTFWDQKYYYNSKKYIVNPPGADRDYSGVELIFKKRYSNGYSFNASYVFAKSTGLIGQEYWDSEGRQSYYNNPNKHENAEGRLPLERRHQFKLEAMVKAPLGIDLSTSIQYLAGYPHARFINSKEIGLKLRSSQTIRAEKCGSYEYPDLIIFDVRVAKNFRLSKQFGLMLFADIFNLLNEGKATTFYTTSSSKYTAFREMTAIQGPRIFRFGFKLNFN